MGCAGRPLRECPGSSDPTHNGLALAESDHPRCARSIGLRESWKPRLQHARELWGSHIAPAAAARRLSGDSSRRVSSWLSFKRLFWAVMGKAGGTAVMTTVDHT